MCSAAHFSRWMHILHIWQPAHLFVGPDVAVMETAIKSPPYLLMVRSLHYVILTPVNGVKNITVPVANPLPAFKPTLA